jgi:hypothetical protein
MCYDSMPRAPRKSSRSARNAPRSHWIRHVVAQGLAAVSAAGPTGWIALVAITGMGVAGYCVHAMLTLASLRN